MTQTSESKPHLMRSSDFWWRCCSNSIGEKIFSINHIKMASNIDKKISRTQYLQTSTSTLKLNVRAKILKLEIQLGGNVSEPKVWGFSTRTQACTSLHNHKLKENRQIWLKLKNKLYSSKNYSKNTSHRLEMVFAKQNWNTFRWIQMFLEYVNKAFN